MFLFSRSSLLGMAVLLATSFAGVTANAAPAKSSNDSTTATTNIANGRLMGLNIDGILGLDLISGGSSSTSNFGFGGRVGYHLDYHWEIGVSVTTTSNSTTVINPTGGNNLSLSSALTLILADLNYHLSDDLNPLYFGIRLGTGLTSSTSINTAANFAYGVVGGYDYAIGDSVTIGPKIAYTMVNQSNTSNQGDFQAQATIKYFFY